MERGVIHHNHSIWRKGRKKLVFKPELKQTAFHCTSIYKRRNDFLTQPGCNNSNPFILVATDCSLDLLSSGSISIFPMQICVNPSFIHISNLFRWDFCDLFLIYLYLFWILFPVMYRLFLRVIPNRSNALRIAVSQQLNSLAISLGYASGCA